MEATKVNSSFGEYYYIDSASSSDVLSGSQMQANVKCLYSIVSFYYKNWTVEAVAALCGNAQSEGALNPNQWQYGLNKSLSGGYGLWQWTPATKFIDWCTQNGYPTNDILHQVIRLEWERANGQQYYKTSSYNFSFTSFLTESHPVSTLAKAWLYNYERPKDPTASEAIRVSRSESWYTFLTGQTPTPPVDPEDPDKPINPDPPTPERKRGMPFYLYPAWKRR